VISDAKEVHCYVLNDSHLTPIEDLYGLDANQVLLKVMDTEIRNEVVQKQLTELLELIHHGNWNKAKVSLSELEKELSADDLELAKARLLIKRLEVLRAKNR
jgi:hypothetical protein